MSYCRFSSDDFRSDVYVYEHVDGGFVTHVACTRVLGDIPKVPRPALDNKSEFFRAHRAQMEFMKTAERAAIDLPHAGESFSHDSATECFDNLLRLRGIGYHVPQYALDGLLADSLADNKDGA